MTSDGAAASLRSRLVASLRQRLRDAPATEADALRTAFRALAEDYRTFRLMDELPAHADGAHSAWRELVPEYPEALSRRQLLELLETAYREAIAAPPEAGAAEPQDGQ